MPLPFLFDGQVDNLNTNTCSIQNCVLYLNFESLVFGLIQRLLSLDATAASAAGSRSSHKYQMKTPKGLRGRMRITVSGQTKKQAMIQNEIEEKTDGERESLRDIDSHKLLLKCPNLFFMLKEHYIHKNKKFDQKSAFLNQNKFSLFQIDTHTNTHPM